MTANEFQERLVSLLHRRPFIPFEVELLYVATNSWLIGSGCSLLGWRCRIFVWRLPMGKIYLFDYTRTRQFNANSSTTLGVRSTTQGRLWMTYEGRLA